MTSKRIKLILMHAGVLFALFLCPHLISKYWLLLVIEALTLAIFTISLDLIMGYAGIVSFGHAAFFGLGGYALGVTVLHVAPSIWLALIVGYLHLRMLGFVCWGRCHPHSGYLFCDPDFAVWRSGLSNRFSYQGIGRI